MLYLLWTLIGFVAGLCVGATWQKPTFLPTFTFGQILQPIIFLAAFLIGNHFYARHHDARKKTTEILIDLISGILLCLEKAHDSYHKFSEGAGKNKPNDWDTLNRFLKEYSYRVWELDSILKNHQRLPVIKRSVVKQLKRQRKEYKDCTTREYFLERVPGENLILEAKLYNTSRAYLRSLQLMVAGSQKKK